MFRIRSRGAKTVALTAASAAALAIPAFGGSAFAAPSYAGNPVGNGITSVQGTCDGMPVTLLTNNNNSSDNGGWSAARIVGGGVLTPLTFQFSLVDMTTNVVLWSGTKAKGGGHPADGGSVSCTFPVEDSGMTVADAIAAGQLDESMLPSGTNLSDELGFSIAATAIRRG